VPDFKEVLAGMPGAKDLPPATREGLVNLVVADIAGRHRWPFLLRVQQTYTWAASDSIQSLPGVSRIWNIMYPNDSGDYYPLTELSDTEFQRWIEKNPNETVTRIWRDAGLDGDKYQFELYAAPSAAKTLKIDYTALPAQNNIEDLPYRFRLLVMRGVQAHAGALSMLDYELEIQRAIAREQDLQGRRSTMGMDPVQASRFRNVNNPS